MYFIQVCSINGSKYYHYPKSDQPIIYKVKVFFARDWSMFTYCCAISGLSQILFNFQTQLYLVSYYTLSLLDGEQNDVQIF